MHLMEKFPATRPAMEQLAVSRFASALAAYTASGINTDEAMRRAIDVVEHEGLKAKATAAYGLMIDAESPRSLAQAISEAEVFEQIHARLLTIGTRSIMIHGKTAQMQQRRTRRVVAVIAAVVLAVLLWFAWDMTSAQTEAQSAASVRTAVLDAAMQCAAVEGAYPARLSYLEEHYGLIVNHQDYAVTYEAFASNVPPSVVVVPR